MDSIRLNCDCGCQDLVLIKDEEYDRFPYFHLDFRISAFYAGQSVWEIMKERIRMAWLALRKGNYIHNSIIVKPESLKQMSDDILGMLNEPRTVNIPIDEMESMIDTLVEVGNGASDDEVRAIANSLVEYARKSVKQNIQENS